MTNVTVLPLPGAVDPAPGVGVTLHEQGLLLPATILRAGLGIFWCRIDRDSPMTERLTPAMRDWTYRVVQQRDGMWRTHDMQRVEIGVRRARAIPELTTEEDRLAAKVDRIEPWLLKRRWYPMTYMMIPSVLRSADELLNALAAYRGPERERVAALHERLTALRKGFRNIGGGMASAATER